MPPLSGHAPLTFVALRSASRLLIRFCPSPLRLHRARDSGIAFRAVRSGLFLRSSRSSKEVYFFPVKSPEVWSRLRLARRLLPLFRPSVLPTGLHYLQIGSVRIGKQSTVLLRIEE